MSDPFETVKQKVAAIFVELVGERAKRLDGSEIAQAAMDAITAALAGDHGETKAAKIGFHMADWNWDAAFIVALHLFPEKFSKEEIDAGIGLFLCHAPNHIREACRLTGQYVWESFPEDDETSPEFEMDLTSIAVARFPGKGRGVVALRAFNRGDLIERAPVIALPREDVPPIRKTRLASYYYEWGDDCQQAGIVLGYGSIYNHSYEPNARYEFHEDRDCLEFYALREVQIGEEITLNYNNLEESANEPMKFEVK